MDNINHNKHSWEINSNEEQYKKQIMIKNVMPI